MKTKLFVLLIMAAFASEEYKNAENDTNSGNDLILVKIEEDEYVKKKGTSQFIGVTYKNSKWCAQRRSKKEKNMVSYGYYDNEETAAHASDTLARKLMKKEEQDHRLNFPYDDSEVHPEEKRNTSNYIGVTHNKKDLFWCVKRWSRNEKKNIAYGYYDDENTAAHASDTFARKLMENGEQGHKLNFPDDDTEVHKKKTSSKYFGVTYTANKWRVTRQSKNEKRNISYGCYDDEESAAHASDTLARELMDNGEQGHKINFPDDHTEVYPKEKKYSSKYFGVSYNDKICKWYVTRRSKNEKKNVSCGYYDDEESAAHASDTLARELMEKGEQGHILNFPDDDSEVHPEEYQKNKRKRQDVFKDN